VFQSRNPKITRFWTRVVETKHLPESMSRVLLKMVNAEIDALNDKLLKEYGEMLE